MSHRLWIARDDKKAVPDSSGESDPFYVYTEKPRGDRVFLSKRVEFTSVGGKVVHIPKATMDAIGIDVAPGQCRQYKLVEVKPRTRGDDCEQAEQTECDGAEG